MKVYFYLVVLLSTITAIDIKTVKANLHIETLQIDNIYIIYNILQSNSKIIIPDLTSKIQYDIRLLKIDHLNSNSLEVSILKEHSESDDKTITFHLEDNKGLLIRKENNLISISGFQNLVIFTKNDYQYNFKISLIQKSNDLYNIKIDDEQIKSIDMYDKVKVFINGAWIGITDSPQELYLMLKDKKYKGIELE